MMILFRMKHCALRWVVLVAGLLLMAMPVTAGAACVEGTTAAIGARNGVYGDVTVPDEVWEPCAPGGISSLSVSEVEAANQNTAYAIIDNSPGKVLKTTDYGDSWSVIDLASGFGWTNQISVVDDQTVWVGSTHSPGLGVAITTNGGGMWGYAGGPAYMYSLEATSSVSAWAGGFSTPTGFICYTGDGGANWPPQLYGAAVHDIESYSTEVAWAVGEGGYHGWIYRYNGAGGWNDQTPSSPVPTVLYGCWAVDADTAWAVGGSTILRTTDGGANWESFTAPGGVSGLKDVTALDADTAFAVGASGAIIKTSDGGDNWTRMYNPSGESLNSVYAVDATHAWAVGEHGTVLRLVQANTRVGSGVTVDLGGGDTATFGSVTSAGNTIKSSATAPSGGEFDYHISLKCVDISTSASFTGTVEVKFPYGEMGWDERAYRMFHKTGSGWEDITTAIDTENNVITGQATSLSEFMLIYPVPKITSIDPSWGVRGTTVDADLYGYGFWDVPETELILQLKNGETAIDATDIVVHDLYHVSCKFPLPADAALDTWDVYILNPDTYDYQYWGFKVMDPMPPPAVTSTDPGFALRGTQARVKIIGTGFWHAFPVYPTAWLSRAGEADIVGTLYTMYGADSISYTFDLPPGAYSGLWDVTLKNPDGQQATKVGCFMVTGGLPAPTLASVTPDTGVLGDTVNVTLEGTGFWGTPTITVYGPDPGQGGILATNKVLLDDTTITCEFPLYANRKPGTWNVYYKNQDNQEATIPGGFTITSPAPAISDVSPASGATGMEVTIFGTAFGASRWDSCVTFGGVQATEYPSWSATQIKVKVPAGLSGPVKVKVTTDWGESNEDDFTVGTPPVVPAIATFTPAQGAAGTEVTINGTGFGAERGSSLVKFGTIKATSYTSWSDTQIVVVVPAPASRKGPLTVTTAGGISNIVYFKVKPTVNSFTPTQAVAGTVVTVNGTGFGSTRGVSYVNFGGVKATSYPSWSNTQVKVKVPSGASGAASLVLVTSGGGSVPATFKVKPNITKLTPTSGAPGTVVTINGTCFGKTRGTSCVKFGSKKATAYVSWSNTVIKVKVPSMAAGSVQVKVTTPGGTSAGKSFTVK